MPQYVKVRLLDAPRFLDRAYSYALPASLAAETRPGSFVTVPFGGGNRRRMGLVTEVTDVAEYDEVKPVLSIVTPRISLSAEMLGLVSFLRETTLCATGDAVHTMIPAGAFSGVVERILPTGKTPADVTKLTPEETFFLSYLLRVGGASTAALQNRFGEATEAMLRRLLKMELITRELLQKGAMREKQCVTYEVADKETAQALVEGALKKPRLGEKQRSALALLLKGACTADVLREQGFAKAVLDGLSEKGLVAAHTARVWRNPYADAGTESRLAHDFSLNAEQQAVFEKITALADDGEAHAVLLHGVTGSGKTPTMLKVIDHVLERGQGVIVLLPEIALTPQTLSLFCSRYGQRVAVMHSALSAGERLDTYYRILEGEADVVVGTRSAVFAPVRNLGLIVMDEEHEHTYKSDMNPKYHARDVARWRCAHHKATLLLCSATPSLESYKRAREGRYTLLQLKTRHAGATLPTVQIADMRGEAGEGNLSPIGRELRELLTANAAAGNQSILFLNRRGYNHVVTCRSCGEALTCPSCSVTLTYHTKDKRFDEGYLLCHFCGRRKPLPKACPSCNSPHLFRAGYGTQRVEEELATLLPDKRVLRMDTDTTGTRTSYEELLGAFRRREAEVLLGTQMVTKGHDFPDVTLVGVLMADASLYLDDYRAAERTFSMLTQVIGRAGRAGKAGTALIQTSNPDHEVIRLAAEQNYEAFYEREIALRRALVFPPFCDIALLTLSHTDERKLMPAARALSEELTKLLAAEFSDVQVIAFGPFEAPIYRADGKYRMRMVLKCALNKRTREMLGKLLDIFGKQKPETPLLSVDLNPSNL
ncbi:MAG: primosomal protein N' [Clostridia bacterium]|nr:primosomal protein N' [Clostridia bacterium]